MLFIGLDVGTQGARVIVSDENGSICSEAVRPMPQQEIGALPAGWSEQDAETWWQLALPCLEETARNLLAAGYRLEDVRAIGVTSTSATVVALDDTYQPLHPAIMYNDVRAQEETHRINEAASELCKKLGYRFQPSFALPKILWLKEHRPEVYEKARVFLHAADFMAAQLTGDYSASDRSNVLKTGYDVVDLAWPSFIEEDLGIDLSRLPKRVVRPGEVVGNLSTSIGKILGLATDTKVVAAGTDSTASLIASGAVNPGESSSVLGTTLAVKNVSRDLVKDPSGRIYCQVHPDGFWLVGGASSVGGECVKKVFAGEDLKALDRAAAELSPTKLYVYPLVRRGERFPFANKDAEGFVVGTPSGRNELYAGYLEGVALVEKWCFDALEDLGSPAGERVHVTGGACKSDEWLQIRANALNKPLVKPEVSETALGAAILAASNTHYSSTMEAASRMVHYEKSVSPEKDKAEAFQEKYCEFRRLCKERGYV